MQTCSDTSDKNTDNAFPIYFGDRCHVGDEELRRQYHRSVATKAISAEVPVSTKVAVTGCNDQRCSYWTAVSPLPDKPVENNENCTKSERGCSSTSVKPVGVAMMGPLNIIAAIIPFESTWSATAYDEDDSYNNDGSSSDSMGSVIIDNFSSGSDSSSKSTTTMKRGKSRSKQVCVKKPRL